jgi:conjugative transfer signal peptidase TraF
MRRAAIGLLAAAALGWVAIASGLKLNGSPSFPEGLYLASSKKAEKGDLVFVNPPALPIFMMARDRGYLNVLYSPTAHLLKRLVGTTGDHVTIDSTGVEVNGVRLKNSAPLPSDAGGRPLRAWLLKDYVLGADEVLVMSEYSPDSFDSRYFGPIPASTIESVATQLLTFQ